MLNLGGLNGINRIENFLLFNGNLERFRLKKYMVFSKGYLYRSQRPGMNFSLAKIGGFYYRKLS